MDKLKLITAATVPPVTLAEARAHLRIDDTSEDTLITTLLTVAADYAELRTGRALISQTWEQYFDAFPSTPNIEIKLPPLQSITSIKYYDSNNSLQTFAASNYDVDIVGEPGNIRLVSGSSWPGTYSYRQNAVIIKFIAGYGAASTNIPEIIRAAIKLLISYFFENRDAVLVGGSVFQIPIPKAIEDLFTQYSMRESV